VSGPRPASPGRVAGLVAVLALLAVALFVGTRSRAAEPVAADPRLAAARAAAALPACPPGLTTDLPDLRLPCFGGWPDVAVSRPPGRPTVVNLWATWCPPCVDEVPELVAFAAAAGDRVGVVGVAHQDSPLSVYTFAQQFRIGYPLLRDDEGDVLRKYGSFLPVTLLVAGDGALRHVQVGAYPTVAALQDAVAVHLGVRV
jgi:thiol-disulfide isomerase/thioredoxin